MRPTRPTLPRALPLLPALLPALLAVLAMAGCGKVQEVASEKAAEKMMESAISKDGGTAKVDINGQGSVKAEGVDKDGKAYKVEIGQANVSEKDIGVAFYPGAKVENGNRIANGDTQMSQVELVTPDAVGKVTEWYRAQLKPRMTGAQSMEQTTQDSAMLMVGSNDNDSLVVNISKDGDAGSRISLMHGTKTP